MFLFALPARDQRMARPVSSSCLLLWLGLSVGSFTNFAGGEVSYNRQIRPILSDHCFSCHGPDSSQRQADLRLDLRAAAVAAGALVPGKVDESSLAERISSDDPDILMPPAEAQKPLTAAQKRLLIEWIAGGAAYEQHWAYVPPRRSAVPTFAAGEPIPTHPIDRFIQAAARTEGLTPSPEADRRTLIRRLYLDLLGLPPTPAEVDVFIEDPRPNAYELVVDRLLQSPHYGERMATPWLDVVRYADTVGFHGDQNQNAWAYRDYVIESFQQNKPFDQFTREQLAGDLLPDPTSAALTATCFNRLNMMTREGGAQPLEYLAKYTADRVRTVGMAWLGSTFACAECHDHKFDPITTRDFYALGAFFADIRQWGVYADYGYTPNPDLPGYTNDHPFPPEIKVNSPYLQRRIAQLEAKIDTELEQLRAAIERDAAAKEAFAEWVKERERLCALYPSGWLPQVPVEVVGAVALTTAATQPTSEVIEFASGPASQNQIALRPGAGWLAALRLDILPATPEAPDSVLRRDGSAAAFHVKVQLAVEHAGRLEKLPLGFAAASDFEPVYRNGSARIGIERDWHVPGGPTTSGLASVWLPRAPLRLADDDLVWITLPDNLLANIRLSISRLRAADIRQTSVRNPSDLTLAEGRDPSLALLGSYLRSTATDQSAFKRVWNLDREILAARDGRTPVMVTKAVTPRTSRILPRGNWQDESGEIVKPALPAFLCDDTPSPSRLPRLPRADSAGSGRVACRRLEPVDRTGRDESYLATVFRHRAMCDPRRLRIAGGYPDALRAFGLVGRRVSRERLGRETHGANDGDQPHLPTAIGAFRNRPIDRSGKPSAVASASTTAGGGSGA